MPDKDKCQTPSYALEPLLPYIEQYKRGVVWESACGEGYLTRWLLSAGFSSIITSDILNGEDYFTYEPPRYDIQITNPPFSRKYDWLARAYELGKPFAFIVPVDTHGSGKAQALFNKYGAEFIHMSRRVDYKMPVKGWLGDAQFNSMWVTWGLGIGKEITYVDLEKPTKYERSTWT